MPPSVAARLDNSPQVIPDSALIDKRTNKPRRISKPLKEAVRGLLDGKYKTVTDAAKAVGLSRWHLSDSLGKAHVQVFIASERARTLANGSLRAAARLVDLMEAQSEHVALQASDKLLAFQGILAPSQHGGVQVNVNVTPGYIVKLRHAEGTELDGQAVDVTPGADGQPVAGGTIERGER